MSRSRIFRPDFIVAMLAVIIGLCTMFVYIYQARIMSKQLHAAVWPYMEIYIFSRDSGYAIVVENKGVGPAKINRFRIVVDGVEYNDDSVDSILFKVVGKKINRDYTKIESRLFSAGENSKFLEFKDVKSLQLLDSAFKHHTITFTICYCSVFDQCWRRENGKTTECKNCD